MKTFDRRYFSTLMRPGVCTRLFGLQDDMVIYGLVRITIIIQRATIGFDKTYFIGERDARIFGPCRP